MAKFVVKDGQIYYEEHNISGLVSNATLGYSQDVQEDTSLGDSYRSRLPGLVDTSVDISGFWDSTEDAEFFSRIGAANSGVMSIAPQNVNVGSRGYIIEVEQASYQLFGAIGEVMPFTINAQGKNALVKGVVAAVGAKTASGESTGFNLGTVGANDSLFSSLHVISNSGSGDQTLDVTIVSDDDGTFNSASTTRLTFDQVTTTNLAAIQSAVGAISDPWFRAEWDIAGSGSPSFTIFIVIGVRPNL